MKLRILSWNIRGANDSDKRRIIKSLIKAQKRIWFDGFCWVFTRVYGPAVGRFREDFWEELGTIRGLWQDPWCIEGDFNVIRFLGEMNSISRLYSAMRRFLEVNEDLEFRDLPFGAIQSLLPRLVFDHCPILLDDEGARKGPSPFRFENM
ncbi:hypothetical protein AAG906_004233 [Vitis piasezkii]